MMTPQNLATSLSPLSKVKINGHRPNQKNEGERERKREGQGTIAIER